jgi:fatty acid desaturase
MTTYARIRGAVPQHVSTSVALGDPQPQPPSRNEYAELKRLVEANGLLKPQARYFVAKIVVNAFLLGIGLFGLRLAGSNPWWWLADVVFLSFAFVQVALLGHDITHLQFVRAGRGNTALALVLGNLLVGVSHAWWKDNHDSHHARPNDLVHDPNVNILFLACSPEQALNRPRWVRWILQHQVALLVPIFCLEFFSMHQQSFDYALRRRPGCARAELPLLVGHFVLYGTVLILALGPSGALVFALVHHLLTGLYMATIFAPNHKGMPLAPASHVASDFLREQVLTARNVRGNWLVDLVYGGLNYQIEHHLFPSMPRNNLRRARPIVQAHCEVHGVAYSETSLFESWREILAHFGNVSRALPGLDYA